MKSTTALLLLGCAVVSVRKQPRSKTPHAFACMPLPFYRRRLSQPPELPGQRARTLPRFTSPHHSDRAMPLLPMPHDHTTLPLTHVPPHTTIALTASPAAHLFSFPLLSSPLLSRPPKGLQPPPRPRRHPPRRPRPREARRGRLGGDDEAGPRRRVLVEDVRLGEVWAQRRVCVPLRVQHQGQGRLRHRE